MIFDNNYENKQFLDNLKLLEEAKENKREVLFKDNKDNYKILLHKIIYLDGALSFLGENIPYSYLLHRPIVDLEIESIGEKKINSNIVQNQIIDYINAIWKFNESDKRLVLKVLNGAIDLYPKYHYFGNPYITTNFNNDIIWGATVERSDYIDKWLKSLGVSVEILSK